MPQPTIMRVQPEEVVKTWRTNSALDGGTQLPRVSWSRAIAAPSQTKKTATIMATKKIATIMATKSSRPLAKPSLRSAGPILRTIR